MSEKKVIVTIDVNVLSAELAKAMVVKFQGPKALQEDGNTLKENYNNLAGILEMRCQNVILKNCISHKTIEE